MFNRNFGKQKEQDEPGCSYQRVRCGKTPISEKRNHRRMWRKEQQRKG
jgi:hypothetical protein